MAKRYGHIGQVAQRQAVEILDNLGGTQPNSPRDESTAEPSGRSH